MNPLLSHHFQESQPAKVIGCSGVTTNRYSSQIARLADRDGTRRPDAHDRTAAYEAPSKAPSAATDSCECFRSAASMATASGPVGSDNRDTLNASAPPKAKRVPPSVAGSSISQTRYGKVESLDRTVMATLSPKARRTRTRVASSIGAPLALEALEAGFSSLGLAVPRQRLPVPDDAVWRALDAFGVRMEAGIHGRDGLFLMRAFADVIGEGNRRAEQMLKEVCHD